jgi:hypothetical protein
MSMRRLIGQLQESEAGVTIRVLKGGADADYDDRDFYKKWLSNYPSDLQKKSLDLFDRKKEANDEIAKLKKELEKMRSEEWKLGEELAKHGKWFAAKNGDDIEWKNAAEIEQARKNRK